MHPLVAERVDLLAFFRSIDATYRLNWSNDELKLHWRERKAPDVL